MKNKFFILGFLFLIILVMAGFVSAGLCRGGDGYYHDCDNYYYRNGEKIYDTEFYYDREKYIVYYDYRNNFGYGYREGYGRDEIRVDRGRYTCWYSNNKGYHCGYDKRAGDHRDRRDYHKDYDHGRRNAPSKLVYRGTERERCTSQWTCYPRDSYRNSGRGDEFYFYVSG